MSSALFMQTLRSQWSVLDRLEDTVNPRPADFQEPRPISVEFSELLRNPVGALRRWLAGPETALKDPFLADLDPSESHQSGRFPVRPSRFEGFDLVEFPQRKAYIVETFEQPPGGVIVNRERHHDRSRDDIPILKIHSDFQTGMLTT